VIVKSITLFSFLCASCTIYNKIIIICVYFQDYNYSVTCVTDCDKFVVNIRAYGHRPILDFPDEVVFPVVPVKTTSSKTILVRNVGSHCAQVQLCVSK